jgi:hypothetical protein
MIVITPIHLSNIIKFLPCRRVLSLVRHANGEVKLQQNLTNGRSCLKTLRPITILQECLRLPTLFGMQATVNRRKLCEPHRKYPYTIRTNSA